LEKKKSGSDIARKSKNYLVATKQTGNFSTGLPIPLVCVFLLQACLIF
jgi:hypothetical protein